MFPNHFNYCNNEGLDDRRYGNILKVLGQGILNVKPDMAEVVIGIITEKTQLEIAQKENTKQAQKMLANIKVIGVSSEDIQTQNYSVNVKYDYIDGKQVFRGYTVSNYFKVLIRDITIVGQVIDAAVKGGANFIYNVNFTVSNTSIYYGEALKLAIKDAQNKSMAIASKLKVNINIIPIQIMENSDRQAFPLATSYKVAAAVTPIEVGENKIVANIEATFIY